MLKHGFSLESWDQAAWPINWTQVCCDSDTNQGRAEKNRGSHRWQCENGATNGYWLVVSKIFYLVANPSLAPQCREEKHFFFIFHNIWDKPSHWLIFFKMVKTTNQLEHGKQQWKLTQSNRAIDRPHGKPWPLPTPGSSETDWTECSERWKWKVTTPLKSPLQKRIWLNFSTTQDLSQVLHKIFIYIYIIT